MFDEDAHHRVGDFGRVRKLNHYTGIASEVLVARDATEAEPKINAWLDAETRLHIDRLEADVVGILENGNCACAIEGDIEFSGQTIERAVVQNVEMPFAR